VWLTIDVNNVRTIIHVADDAMEPRVRLLYRLSNGVNLFEDMRAGTEVLQEERLCIHGVPLWHWHCFNAVGNAAEEFSEGSRVSSWWFEVKKLPESLSVVP